MGPGPQGLDGGTSAILDSGVGLLGFDPWRGATAPDDCFRSFLMFCWLVEEEEEEGDVDLSSTRVGMYFCCLVAGE